VIQTEVRITLGHLCCPVPQEFSDRVKIHTSHDQSTGEGMAIAMPGVGFQARLLNGRDEPAPRTVRIWKYGAPTRRLAQLFEGENSSTVQRNVTRVSVLGSGQIHLAAPKVNLRPLQRVLFAHADTGMDGK